MTGEHWDRLRDHLFSGDGDEHGAVLRCGVAQTSRGTRLLVKDVILAEDGKDYVPGNRGYRMLTEEFVLDNIDACDEERLAYLAVHCHGGDDRVAFSGDDLASHQRGYPALLGISRGMPVGALVFAQDAVAGDIWLNDGSRVSIDHLEVVGRPRRVLTPNATPTPKTDPRYDRQSRLFGDRGQAILANEKVAVIGGGGGGSILNELLAHLGTGELVIVDPDRVDVTNLPRVIGARPWDAKAWMVNESRPAWLQQVGAKLQTKKVRIAARVARRANPRIKVHALFASVDEPGVDQLKDCDQIFLAADTALARHVVNAISHQYLIPVTQIGAKATTAKNGAVTDVFSVSRVSTPGHGCLWCNGLIDQNKLREEITPREQLDRQRYVDDESVPSPSVITLNSVAASLAVNEWLMAVTGLLEDNSSTSWTSINARTGEQDLDLPRRDTNCRECGRRRFARGDGVTLPTKPV